MGLNTTVPRKAKVRRWTLRLAAVYLVGVVVAVAFLHLAADVTWFGTVLAFAPLWPFILPLIIFLPLAVWLRSRWVGGLSAAAAVLVAGPLTGGAISVRPLVVDPPAGRLRVLTCNCGGPLLDKQKLQLVIAELDPDIVCLQEARFGTGDGALPPEWTMANGPNLVAVASRYPVTLAAEQTFRDLGAWAGVGRFTVADPNGPVEVVCLHLPTPRPGLEKLLADKSAGLPKLREVIAYRDRASRTAGAWVGPAVGDLFVAGDFNMTGESVVFRRDWGHFEDAFDRAGNGWGYTFHTTRHGVRIDRILSTPSWRCRAVWVGPDVGSDHRPVVADFERVVP